MKTISLRAYCEEEARREGSIYYAGLQDYRPARTVLAYSKKEARKKLERDVDHAIHLACETERNWQRYIIGTASGCVFIVSWRVGGWEYVIAGPGYKTGVLCITQAGYEQTVEQAKKHAHDQFGGIVYEHTM